MSKEQETIADLNDLVVNCDELRKGVRQRNDA